MGWGGFFRGLAKVGSFALPFVPIPGMQALGPAMGALAKGGLAAGSMGLNALGNKGAAPKGPATPDPLSPQGIAERQASLSTLISDASKRQHTIAEPAVGKALAYYTKLAGGGSMARNAMAPARTGLLDTYSGAERGIERQLAPGPNRDRAISELQRQKAGQLSQLPLQGQQIGVEGLDRLGSSTLSGANSMLTGSSNPLNAAMQALIQSQNQKDASHANWMEFGSSIGSILLPYLLGNAGKPKATAIPGMSAGAASKIPNPFGPK